MLVKCMIFVIDIDCKVFDVIFSEFSMDVYVDKVLVMLWVIRFG